MQSRNTVTHSKKHLASIRMDQCVINKPCKHFYTVRFSAGCCNLIGDRNAFWSPIFADSEPDFKCPIDAVTYTIRNASIDYKRFLRLFNALDPNMLQPAIWNNKLQAYDENRKEFACVDIKIKHVLPEE
ncbi:Molybdenum cofactor guanylyltransferase [Frankliniella fusca]|uniref:Molybdenum cofactor guanylyltransferase n=1 Tax=Frankliniella fusca TaxID=407009 RepID=A0AAE1IWF6_9NEOP|nr:Molybdenum cofactor guanylyltransferase [Frankliniella fusca]